MECQDVRQLLTFFERTSEELDAVERDALRKHLDACPDCAALASQERGVDQAIGVALRRVPSPTGLKEQVLLRLAKERGNTRWKRRAVAAAVAVLLLVIGAGTAWTFLHKPTLTVDDLAPYAGPDWSKKTVEQHLEKQGLRVLAPDRFKYRYLRQVDVVVLHGRRVARLTFSRNDDRTASATVFIIDSAQFNIEKVRGQPGIEIDDDQHGDFIYLIQGAVDLSALENDAIGSVRKITPSFV